MKPACMPGIGTRVLTAISAASVVLGGCASSSGTPTGSVGAAGVVAQPACGEKADPTCPSTPPSYAKDVVPILDAKCNDCHKGGTSGPWPLTSYTDVNDWRGQILSDLLGCTMPLADAGQQLTTDERAMLIGWLACHAPNN